MLICWQSFITVEYLFKKSFMRTYRISGTLGILESFFFNFALQQGYISLKHVHCYILPDFLSIVLRIFAALISVTN